MNRNHAAQMLRIFSLFLLGTLTLPAPLIAAEIKGKVVEVQEDSVNLATESEYLPNVGDPVEIYFEIPGLDDSVHIGAGKVSEVTADVIRVKMDESVGKIEKDQLARITSDQPKKRAPGEAIPAGDVEKRPRPNGRLILQDEFEMPAPRPFRLFGPAVMSFRQLNGEAVMTARSPGVLPVLYPKFLIGDFVAEVDLRVPAATDNSGYGLMFRSASVVNGRLQHYYMLTLQPKLQSVSLSCWNDPNWALAQSFALPPTILASTNRVRLEAVGDHFRIFVNNTFVGEVTDQSIQNPGLIGLCVSAATADAGPAYFGALRVYAPAADAPQPTP